MKPELYVALIAVLGVVVRETINYIGKLKLEKLVAELQKQVVDKELENVDEKVKRARGDYDNAIKQYRPGGPDGPEK